MKGHSTSLSLQNWVPTSRKARFPPRVNVHLCVCYPTYYFFGRQGYILFISDYPLTTRMVPGEQGLVNIWICPALSAASFSGTWWLRAWAPALYCLSLMLGVAHKAVQPWSHPNPSKPLPPHLRTKDNNSTCSIGLLWELHVIIYAWY